jgi:hypothetical protein
LPELGHQHPAGHDKTFFRSRWSDDDGPPFDNAVDNAADTAAEKATDYHENEVIPGSIEQNSSQDRGLPCRRVEATNVYRRDPT